MYHRHRLTYDVIYRFCETVLSLSFSLFLLQGVALTRIAVPIATCERMHNCCDSDNVLTNVCVYKYSETARHDRANASGVSAIHLADSRSRADKDERYLSTCCAVI